MYKKIACTVLLTALMSSGSFAADYDGFYGVSREALKPFARDLGGLLGSGTSQTARPLGFSGFDIGVRGMAQFTPSHGNTVMKKDELFGMGFVQAEIGMPYRIDGFVRGGSFEGVSVAGGGLRYGLWNVSDAKYKINATLLGVANMATHRYFYAIHFNAGVVCSLNVPVVSPFLAAGYDDTRLEAQTVGDLALSGTRVRVTEPRFSGGLRARFNLGYLSAAYTYTHDRSLVNASAGFRF